MSALRGGRADAAPGGMTLVEVLVTTGILLILASLLLALLLRGKVIWQASATHAASRQDLQEVAWRLARELQGSNTSFLTDGSSGGLQALSFVSARDPAGTFRTDDAGQPAWQGHVLYYVAPGTTRLLRKEIRRDFAAAPTTLRALTLAELAAACDGQGKLVSPSVSALKITPQPDGKTAILELRTEATSAHGRADRQGCRLTVLLYNN